MDPLTSRKHRGYSETGHTKPLSRGAARGSTSFGATAGSGRLEVAVSMAFEESLDHGSGLAGVCAPQKRELKSTRGYTSSRPPTVALNTRVVVSLSASFAHR